MENAVISSLPCVSEWTQQAIRRDRVIDNDYIINLFLRIEESNPEIALLVKEMSLVYSTLSEEEEMPTMPVNQAITMALLVYRSLEAQSEADVMSELFDL